MRLAANFALAAISVSAPAWGQPKPVAVKLDYSRLVLQIQGGDGGSVCQFHGSDPIKGTISADRAYSTLAGFPDDASTTEFGKFCDVAFSTKGSQGMGLSQLWSTPSIFQTPPGAVGKHYDPASWHRLDFRMYEADPLPPERYLARQVKTPRGHTVPMLLAALHRARREDQRILFWNDLHTDFPHWMWKDNLRSNPIPEEHWEEAALHIVYYAKYLVARHGIPIHTVSFQNEPDLPNRHAFTPEMLIRISKVLREKLDEAGLTGVRVMPYTSVGLGDVYLSWRKVMVRTLSQTYDLLEGPDAAYQPYIDSLGGHLSQDEPPLTRKLKNTQFWRASGDFDNHYKGQDSVTFDMGPDDQIDEVIRLNTWLYGKGVSLAGIWQVALRMGHTIDDFVLPAAFEVEKTFRHAAIDGAATVYPYVRPGMFLVGGSMGAAAREQYSVDGFGGRGHPEVAVITNSGVARTFRIDLGGVNSPAVDIFQATSVRRKRQLDSISVNKGSVTLTVPPDSVTSLVARRASSRPRVYLVVKDSGQMSQKEEGLQMSLSGSYDVAVLSQVLTPEQQDRFESKRHPVDPMGAAAYVLADSVDRQTVAYAHRSVMAPVVAMGELSRMALGVQAGGAIEPGAPLAFRDRLDPPASLLERGLPKACGRRIHWEYQRGFGALAESLRKAD